AGGRNGGGAWQGCACEGFTFWVDFSLRRVVTGALGTPSGRVNQLPIISVGLITNIHLGRMPVRTETRPVPPSKAPSQAHAGSPTMPPPHWPCAPPRPPAHQTPAPPRTPPYACPRPRLCPRPRHRTRAHALRRIHAAPAGTRPVRPGPGPRPWAADRSARAARPPDPPPR